MANVHGFRDMEQQNRAANNYNRIRGINNPGNQGGGGGGAGMHPLLGKDLVRLSKLRGENGQPGEPERRDLLSDAENQLLPNS